MRKLTKEEFITKAKQVHGDKYSYNLVQYINSKVKVKIICSDHGVFEQIPNDHFKGIGCTSCAGNKKSNTEEFITKAKQVHGDKYSYELVEYVNNKTPVKIICSDHGVFEQRPSNHMIGQGCIRCSGSKKLTTEEFITKAKQVHDGKYFYDKSKYIKGRHKITITCPEHDDFEQTPSNHMRGHGCPDCVIYTNQDIISMLTIEEDPIEIDNTIYCRCSKCRQYFIPTKSVVRDRIRTLMGKRGGENRLYCSDECKHICSLYRTQKYPKGFINKIDRSRESQPYLKKLVLERDNHQCQVCGSTEDLCCHHLTGVEINPIESADVDNCITLCYNCHQRVHSSGQCETRRKMCETI